MTLPIAHDAQPASEDEDLPGFARMFGAERAAAFARDHWPTRPFVVHDALSPLPGFTGLPEFASLAGLLTLKRNYMRVEIPDPSDRMLAPTCIQDPSPERAIELYEQGATVYLQHVDAPSFTPWKRGMARDLSTHPSFTVADVFLSRVGFGTKPHYDSGPIIVFQVKGSKRWRYAPNHHIVDPTINHGIGDPIIVPLLMQAPGGMPTTFPPDDVTEVRMRPGSIMFLPRGWWHDTLAEEEESIHVTYLPGLPNWRELLELILEKTDTFRSPPWRESVKDVVPDGNVSRKVMTGLAARLRETADLLEVTPEDDIRAFLDHHFDTRFDR